MELDLQKAKKNVSDLEQKITNFKEKKRERDIAFAPILEQIKQSGIAFNLFVNYCKHKEI